MKKIFLTTRKINESTQTPYWLLINSAKKNFEDVCKEKTEIKLLKLNRTISIKTFLFFSYKFFSILINNDQILKLKYKDIDLSTYIIAQIFHDYRSYQNKIIFYKNLIINFYTAAKIISTTEKMTNDVVAAFLDHGIYINGILFQCLSKKKIVIYSYQLPRGIFKIDFKKIRKKITYDSAIRLNKSYNLNARKKKLVKKTLNRILYKSEILPWIKRIKFKKDSKKKYSEFTHVIYAHSFTDAQLIWGNDGFLNTKDWLIFTINELLKNKKNNVLLKCHPNFYNKSIGNQAIWDKIIFDSFKSEILDKKNLTIIDKPIRNADLLKKLNKKTILVSHHSSAMLEGIYLKFKCICSDRTFWNTSKLKLTNIWSNKVDYQLLLKKKWKQLSHSNDKDFNSVVYDYLLNEFHLEGKKFFYNIVINTLKIKDSRELNKLEKSGSIKKIYPSQKKRLVNNVSKNIESLII